MFTCKKAIFGIIALSMSIGLSAQSKKAIKLVERAKEDMREGTLVAASVKLTQAIAKYENYAEAYELRAMSFQGMGSLEQAIKDYEKAVELDPGRIISNVRLLGLFKEAKEWAKVKKYARIILKNHPGNICPATFDLAHAHDEMAEEAEALALYQSFLKMDCENMDEKRKVAQDRIEKIE